MKLMHYLFTSPICFDNMGLQQLVFEDTGDFGVMLKELSDQIHGSGGRYRLFEDNGDIDLSKNMILIDSPINLECLDKVIIQGYVNRVVSHLNEGSHQLETYELISKTEKMIISVMDELDSNMVSEGLDISKLVKAFDIRVGHEDVICADLIQTCSLIKKFTNVRLVVISNVSCYIQESDIIQLVRGLAYLNTPILLIDHDYVSDYPCKLFDADFCELNFKTSDRYFFDV